MIKKINFQDFTKAFEDHGRAKQFEYTLQILFDEIETIEQDTGEQYELDVIELCVEWSEQSLSDVAQEEGVTTQDVLTAIEDQGNDHLITEVKGDHIAVMLEIDWNDIYEGLRELKEEENIERNEGIGDTVDGFAGELTQIARELFNQTDKVDINDVIDEVRQLFEELEEELTEHHYNQ